MFVSSNYKNIVKESPTTNDVQQNLNYSVKRTRSTVVAGQTSCLGSHRFLKR